MIMSQMVHYKGVLTPVLRNIDETLEDQCKRLYGKVKENCYYETYEEALFSEVYDKYVVHDNFLYSVKRQQLEEDSDVFNATINDDDTIEFEVLYYNGGCSFDEAIGYALEDK